MAKLAPIIPGKPLNILPEFNTERLYHLSYLFRGNQQSKLLLFKEDYNMQEVVERCKEYCIKNHYRFVWVELAITIMEE